MTFSKSNPLIKKARMLAISTKDRKENEEAIIYGEHVVWEAIRHNLVKKIFILESKVNKYADLLDKLPKEDIISLPPKLMNYINVLNSEIEIAGLIYIIQTKISNETYQSDVLILENIQDPGNLGAIFRVAKACNLNHIILSSQSVDPYNVKVTRGSQGLQFGLNVYTNVDVPNFISNYKGLLVATTPRASESIYDIKFNSPIGWVFGNEGQGLTKQTLNLINKHATIPMANKEVESLNIVTAVTVCLFETVRARSL